MGTPPPPGWYDDPWPGPAVRWWDGYRWTEHTRTGHAAGPVASFRPRVGGGWFVLAGFIQALLGLSLALSLTAMGGAWWMLALAQRWVGSPSTYDAGADDNSSALFFSAYGFHVVVLLACGVLFICWLYRAHRSDRMQANRLHHDSGWAIGGWFVPVVSLWRPLQMVLDVARGASEDGEPGRSRRLSISWWVAFLAALLVDAIALGVGPEDGQPVGPGYFRALRRFAVAQVVGTAVWTVAAVLAILVVHVLTRLVRDAEFIVARAEMPTPASTAGDGPEGDVYPGRYLDDTDHHGNNDKPLW